MIIAMLTRLQIGLASFLLSSAIAQQFSPSPPLWRKPNMTISSQERIQRASDTLRTTMGGFDDLSGQFTNTYWGDTGPFYINMAEFDLVTNGTQYKDRLLSYFPKAEVSRRGFLDQFVSLPFETRFLSLLR
ncbi:hypothetical protein PM082_015368 [Marasmius tenuissimus]|nr:hypothetical protein PM082_015368 [Marasmius tenuissimus]